MGSMPLPEVITPWTPLLHPTLIIECYGSGYDESAY